MSFGLAFANHNSDCDQFSNANIPTALDLFNSGCRGSEGVKSPIITYGLFYNYLVKSEITLTNKKLKNGGDAKHNFYNFSFSNSFIFYSLKHTHKKNKAVEGTKKRTQKSKSNLANNKNHFSQFRDFEFDFDHLKDLDKYLDLNNLKELDQYFDLNYFKDLDQYFELNGFIETIKQIEVYLSNNTEFVSLKGYKGLKKANKNTSEIKKLGRFNNA